MNRRYSGDLIDVRLGPQEVGETHPREHLIDAALEQAPNGTNAAGVRRIAPLILHFVVIAIHFKRDVLGCLDDIFHADLLRYAPEQIAAASPPDRLDESRAPQAQQDLLDVVMRQPFLLGELARRDRTLPRTLREINRND